MHRHGLDRRQSAQRIDTHTRPHTNTHIILSPAEQEAVRLGPLGEVVRLTREAGLVALDALSGEQQTVRGNTIPGFHHHDVAHHEILRVDLQFVSVKK